VDLDGLETGPVDGPVQPVEAVNPNTLLNRLREAAQETMKTLDDPEMADDVAAAEAELATAFLQLDDWMSRGGFPPGAWQDSDE
jgi:hypothetical protein